MNLAVAAFQRSVGIRRNVNMFIAANIIFIRTVKQIVIKLPAQAPINQSVFAAEIRQHVFAEKIVRCSLQIRFRPCLFQTVKNSASVFIGIIVFQKLRHFAVS